MARQIRINVQVPSDPQLKAPPPWVAGDQPESQFWYFVNEHGEQWVARRFRDFLRFSGKDIGWAEIRVSAADAEKALTTSAELKQMGFQAFVLGNTILAGPEALWVASVLAAAFPAKVRYGEAGASAPAGD